MAVDVSGGLDHELEYPFATRPDDPAMSESMNAWVWGGGDVGLPRVGIEAVADQWDTHDAQLNMALADGRVVTTFAPGPVHDPLDPQGRARRLGAGPMAFEVIEPFGQLRLTFDGTASQSTVGAQLGESGGDAETVDVHVDIELRPAVPPWMNGSLLADAQDLLDNHEEGDLMGHPWRFEQLCRAVGTVRIGDEEFTVDGGANRIRRQSVRRYAAFWGHCWQASVFPSGRGFAYIAYPPRDDGRPTYNEGYLFDGDGDLIPARVVDAPWLREATAAPSDISCTIETVDGRRETIGGRTEQTTFMIMPPEVGGGMQLQQAIARYTWDGEEAGGMIERSSRPDQMT